MIYCTKCGTLNSDNSIYCSKCSTPLHSEVFNKRQNYQYQHREHYNQEHHPKAGSGIGLLIAGIIVLFIGLSLYYNLIGLFFDYFWSIILLTIGIWLLIRGLIWSQRKNRQPHA